MSSVGNWLAAAMTIGILSVIFKENELHYIAEHIYVGIAAGYFVAVTFGNYIKPTIVVEIMQNNRWYYLIPAVLGLLIYTKYTTKYQWLARYPVSFTMGTGAGIVLTKTWKPMVLDQLAATVNVLPNAKTSTIINAAIILLGVVCTLTYFLFTVQPKGVPGVASKIGRYIMMAAFGSAFANTVMARVSIFMGRISFLLKDWLRLAS